MTVALTYYLEEQCDSARPFCPNCTNTFQVVSCNSPCNAGPPIICLTPTIPGPVGFPREICGVPVPQPAPAALALQLRPGQNYDESPDCHATIGKPLCDVISDPILLLFLPDSTKTAYPNYPWTVSGGLNPAAVFVWESSFVPWPGTGPVGTSGCFSGLVKFQYTILIDAPYSLDPIKNLFDYEPAFGCVFKSIIMIFEGGGYMSACFPSTPCGGIGTAVSEVQGFSGGGVEWGSSSAVIGEIGFLSFELPLFSATESDAGADNCLGCGTSSDPNYGNILGTKDIPPPQFCQGRIPFSISIPK